MNTHYNKAVTGASACTMVIAARLTPACYACDPPLFPGGVFLGLVRSPRWSAITRNDTGVACVVPTQGGYVVRRESPDVAHSALC